MKGKLITLPGAYVPNVTEEILLNMPEIAEGMLECFKQSLEEAYPEEMTKLNNILSLIEIIKAVTK